MTENKRYKYYEYKGADYILDNPNTELDFIEMLGDCLDAEEIVDRLNKQEELINTLREELELADKQNTKLEKENKQLKDENASMKGRIINAIVKSNQVECNCSPCVCEDYVNEELKKW